jgi:hypothetical protein
VEAGLHHLRLQSNACCPNVTAQPLRHPRLLPGTEYTTTIFKGFLMSTRNDVFALSLGRPSSEPHRPGPDRIPAAPTRGAGGGSTGGIGKSAVGRPVLAELGRPWPVLASAGQRWPALVRNHNLAGSLHLCRCRHWERLPFMELELGTIVRAHQIEAKRASHMRAS